MIEQIKDIAELTPLHWFLAYIGLIVHILMKFGNIKGDLRKALTRKTIATIFSSALLIPVILLICTDTGMNEILPINYLTAFLAGYQTQSIINNLVTLRKGNEVVN